LEGVWRTGVRAAARSAVPDEVLDDLARRLAAARLPPPQSVADRKPGDPAAEEESTIERIVQLLAYWRGGYDWRAQERRLNGVPQFRVKVDGVGLHFLHAPGAGPDPLPLLLCNGWPSSAVEYLGVLPRLTDPAAYGGAIRATASPWWHRQCRLRVLRSMPGPVADSVLDR
jgi:Epoxide hydrolase N terminus